MFKGWRTIIFNALNSAVPILSIPEFAGVIPVEWLPYHALFVVLGNMYLRKITTTPMGKK